MTQTQFDALTAYIDAAIRLAASCETNVGGGHRELAAFKEARDVAEKQLVTKPM